MATKSFVSSFSNFHGDKYIRADEKYYYFLKFTEWNLFNIDNHKLIRLKDILIDDYNIFDFKDEKEYKGIPTGSSYIDEDGCIIGYEKVSLEDHPDRIKYKANNENILISSLRLAKSPALYFENESLSDYVFSNGFYIFRVPKDWNIKFVLYILRTKRLKNLLDNNIYRGIGISAYKDNDLKKIKIPLISKEKQDQIVDQIEPIEQKIKELKQQCVDTAEVINKVFAREFKLDLEKFEKLKKINKYNLNLSKLANNKDLRNSFVFHHESAQFVLNQLREISKAKIKDFISEPITLGATISPSDFDEHGKYYYISMESVKSYHLELDDTQLVSNEYSNSNLNKAIGQYDIIMTRSGVAIGKFALIEDNVKGIFADFTMRIRFKNFNPYFAYYYFRSEYFQHLIHTNKKGLQNKNIFPSQIQELPLIYIPPERQQRIVNEIKEGLDRQSSLKKQIDIERNKIDEIIEKSIADICFR